MFLELFNFILPLPIRWLWFVLYGLILFKTSVLILKKYFKIDLLSMLRDSEPQGDAEFGLRRLDDLILYLGIVYTALALTVHLCPSFLVPLMVTGVVLAAMILPLNRFGLSYRYAFIGYNLQPESPLRL